MAATTVERDPKFAGTAPNKGTLPVAAATKYLKGTIACIDANGRASNVAAGLNAVGVFAHTYDNTAGANDAADIELDYGVFGFVMNGTVAKAGQLVYNLDNQTVTLTVGTNGKCGIVTEVRTINGTVYAFVWVNPAIAAMS
jgi:hypothetical protein